jgi:hypothetical protein
MKAKYSKSTGGIYVIGASKNIPDDALDIPDFLYKRFTHAELDKFDVVDGVVVEYVAPPPTQDALKKAKLAEINREFEKAMQQVIDGIPATERESWKKQEDEARAYISNNSSITPLIDALALSRSVDKVELVTRIIAKADLFAGISGTLIGRRQALEDALNALPKSATPEDIAAITW